MESRKVCRFLEEIDASTSVSEVDFRSRIDSITYPSGTPHQGLAKSCGSEVASGSIPSGPTIVTGFELLNSSRKTTNDLHRGGRFVFKDRQLRLG